jgi:hypothetical protein
LLDPAKGLKITLVLTKVTHNRKIGENWIAEKNPILHTAIN